MQIGVEASRAVENKRIFVVEPDEVTRTALQFILHDENETHEMPNVQAAYQKGRQSPPDLVLLGFSIVQCQDSNVLKEMKQLFPGVKIVLVSEIGEENAAREQLRAGADDLLTKPLQIEKVRKKVDQALKRVSDKKLLNIVIESQGTENE